MIILGANDGIEPQIKTVVTVGNFDGIHEGHQKLFRELARTAAENLLRSVVVTFEPHTRFLLANDSGNYLLTTMEEKIRLIEHSGIDYLMILPFDRTMRDTPPELFIKEILIDRLHMARWCMGEGHAVGRDRTGNEIFLHEMESKYHFYVFTADLLTRNGTTVSSTQIRNLILQGRIAEAFLMLGHPYLIAAQRTRGIQLGRRLGYPTFNFSKPPSRKVIPPPGVYAAELEYKGILERGALYFGDCPTLHDGRDVHFEFYSLARGKEEIAEGAQVFLWLYSHIRGDKAFAGTDELVRQITEDVNSISTFFSKETQKWR